MGQVKSEFELAEAEVTFWRDFVYWWEGCYGNAMAPRILEALGSAEKRFAGAKRSVGV